MKAQMSPIFASLRYYFEGYDNKLKSIDDFNHIFDVQYYRASQEFLQHPFYCTYISAHEYDKTLIFTSKDVSSNPVQVSMDLYLEQ